MNKKNTLWIFPWVIMGFVGMLTNSCDDDDQVLTEVPVLTTTAASAITQTTATSGGNVTDEGSATVTARGVCWSTTANPTTADAKTANGTGTGSYTSSITGLTENTTYYVRAYATNSVGIGYGTQRSFTTSLAVVAPTVTTAVMGQVGITTATCGGNVTDDGGATVTARGVCFSYNNQNPTTADGMHMADPFSGTGSFTVTLASLRPNTTYYLRAFATNSEETSYGSQVTFTTLPETIADIDGNVYHTVLIGTQLWMVENLRTTTYRNGEAIPNVADQTPWIYLTSGAYCNYYNDVNNVAALGRLYNWYAVNTGNLCPAGWHVPTDAECTTLITYLTDNGYGYGGSGSDVAKSLATTSGWMADATAGNVGNDPSSNNTSGFTALASGVRVPAGAFANQGSSGYWWTSTQYATDATRAHYRGLIYNSGNVTSGYDLKVMGLSVRCIKD